jgi:hypothetical protein
LNIALCKHSRLASLKSRRWAKHRRDHVTKFNPAHNLTTHFSIRVLVGTTHYCLLRNFQTPTAPGLFFWGCSGRGVKLITHLHLVPRLRMSGALPLLHLYVFVAWARTALLFAICVFVYVCEFLIVFSGNFECGSCMLGVRYTSRPFFSIFVCPSVCSETKQSQSCLWSEYPRKPSVHGASSSARIFVSNACCIRLCRSTSS